MPYLMGGSTSDDVTVASNTANPANSILYFGWWYPTTLTANNGYWGFQNTETRCTISPAATDRIRVVGQRATTDAVWDFQAAGVTVDKWWWIAVMMWGTSTIWNAPLGWIGSETAPPSRLSATTVTAGSGNAQTGTAGNISLGNTGASVTAAFQGYVAEYGQILDNGPASDSSFYGIAAGGSTTAATLDFLSGWLMTPLWAGQYERVLGRNWLGPGGGRTVAQTSQHMWMVGGQATDQMILPQRNLTAAAVNGTDLGTCGPRAWPSMYPGLSRSHGRNKVAMRRS